MAGVSSATVVIRYITDKSQAVKDTEELGQRFGKFGGAMRKLVAPAAAVLGGLLALGKQAIDSASDLQQAQGAVESVFGASAKAVMDYADTADTRMGLAASAYMNYAALTGSALQNAGFSAEQAVSMTDKAMQRGADMAATFGGTTADAMDAINAAIARGEFDPIEKYGVSLNQTAINAELAARGQDKLAGQALKNAKAQATYDLIMQQTARTAGQFARESDTAAGAQAIMAAEAENARAAIGQGLLPIYSRMMSILANVANWMGRNSTVVMVLAVALGVLAGAILAINVVMTIMNATFLASPIFWIVAGVVALIAVIVLVATKTKFFQKIWQTIWKAIRAVAAAVVSWLRNAWRALISVLVSIARRFQAAWRSVTSAIRSVVSGVVGFFRSAWQGAVSVVRGYINLYRSVFSTAMNVIKGVIRVVVALFKGDWRGAASAVRGIINTFAGFFRGIFNGLAGPIRTVANLIRNTLGGAFSAIRGAASRLGGALSTPFNGVRSVINSVISAVRQLISWLGKIKVPRIKLPNIPNPFSLGLPEGLSPVSAAGYTSPSLARATPASRAGTADFGSGSGGGDTIIYLTVGDEYLGRFVARAADAALDAQNRRIRLRAAI